MAVVKLKLRPTSEEGFLAILTVKALEFETEGFLPPLPPELNSSFSDWQLTYRQINAVRSTIYSAPGVRLTPKRAKLHSNAENTTAVKQYLNQWLNSGDSRWQPIRDSLIEIADKLYQQKEEVWFVIDAKDIHLRRLPWQEWNLLEKHYPQAEVAYSLNQGKGIVTLLPQSSNIRILLTVGRSNGINTKNDLEVIQELENYGAEVICLIQPTRKELCQALWDERGYHIFVFTGHSGSHADGQIGWIELNDYESLSIQEFKEALKQAIHQGLQLAIFNSCDGLGLANQLAQLSLPRCIVMREPVPDPVAVDFLKYFFQEFTLNNSIFNCVYKARKRLEHFQSDYPGAIWLPTICIEPNFGYFNWQQLCGKYPNQTVLIISEQPENKTHHKTKPWLLPSLVGATIISVTILIAILSQFKNCCLNYITVPEGIWLYGGSTSWAPIRQFTDSELKRNQPKFELRYTESLNATPGSGTGIRMLLNGQLTFSQSSRPISDEEYLQAQQRGFGLKQIPIAIEGIAIATHPSLKITGLTISQIKDIYTGKIINWRQVGGPNLKITPYSRRLQDGGTVEFLFDNILNKEKLGSNIVYVHDTTEGLRKLAMDAGGIYYASAPEVVPQCQIKTLPIARHGNNFVPPFQIPAIPIEQCPNRRNKLNLNAFKTGNYPITRQMYVIVKKNGSIEQQAGEAYANLLLTNQGQELINQAGFVRIR